MKPGTVAVLVLLVAVSIAATGGRATEKRQLRVGFVAYSGVVPSSRSIEGQMLLGFLKADKELAVQGQVRFVPPNQDPTGALEHLARQNYDLIIVAYPGSPEALARIAEKFPRVRFVSPGVPIEAFPHPPRNFQGSDYLAEEAAYLAGYLAALMEDRRHGKHVISAVGGIPYSGVTRWTDGFQAGAKKADPAISVLIGYSNDFSNPASAGGGAEPDRKRLRRGLQRRRRLRTGYAPRREGRGRLGGGSRHRPVVPRPARPHECHLASRSRGVRRGSQPCARDLQDRREQSFQRA
jgi:basic membrane lipoprotein Med (substrate-binding protein (PBP1-ABC) superfamily)